MAMSGRRRPTRFERRRGERRGRRGEALVEHVLAPSWGLPVDRAPGGRNHPWDLLLDVQCCDVKTATVHVAAGPRGPQRVWTFARTDRARYCDLLALVCLDEQGELEDAFLIPSADARVSTIEIGRRAGGWSSRRLRAVHARTLAALRAKIASLGSAE